MDNQRERRFGPVTWFALVGGIVFGLLGILVANSNVIIRSEDAPRTILVTMVTLGVMCGIGLGMLVESGRVKLPSSFVVYALFLGSSGIFMLGSIPIIFEIQGSFNSSSFIAQLTKTLPLFSVWLVSVGCAIVGYSKYPKACRWLLFGLALLAIWMVVDLWVYKIAIEASRRRVNNSQLAFRIYAGWQFTRGPLQAFTIASFLIAVFAGRSPALKKTETPSELHIP